MKRIEISNEKSPNFIGCWFLEEKNIFVRGMQPYNLSNYLRVTIGTKNEMKIFLECILSFLKDK